MFFFYSACGFSVIIEKFSTSVTLRLKAARNIFPLPLKFAAKSSKICIDYSLKFSKDETAAFKKSLGSDQKFRFSWNFKNIENKILKIQAILLEVPGFECPVLLSFFVAWVNLALFFSNQTILIWKKQGQIDMQLVDWLLAWFGFSSVFFFLILETILFLT